MPEKARILRGPWTEAPVSRAPATDRSGPDAEQRGKMSLGFVIRQCAVELGRMPNAGELAEWANHRVDERGEYRLFGRKISVAEAEIILRHPGRPVRVRAERWRRSE